VNGAQGEGVTRAQQPNSKHGGCDGDAGKHDDQCEVVEDERFGGCCTRLAGGGVEPGADS
jgi:hypothetical protein